MRRYAIYDRWGTLLYDIANFQPNDPEYGWDGKYKNQRVLSGVYIYQATIEFTDGKARDFSGDVFVK